MNRRSFLAASTAALAAQAQPLKSGARSRPELCIFSKHMAQFNWDEVGKHTRQLGFDGVDLTVRPKGHVLPENVAADLPKAVAAIRAHNLSVPMITTDLTSTADPAARPTLATAAQLGIKFWKVGYWRKMNLEQVKPLAHGLFALSREYGLTAGVHNHSGDYYGALPYEYEMLLQGHDPRVAGFYFDPRHAVVEGGEHGWRVFLNQALRNLKMVAIKDFFWAKQGGQWKVVNCPLGEGMVDWKTFFEAFAKARFTGPMTLHVEYNPKDELAAIARDLEFMKKFVA